MPSNGSTKAVKAAELELEQIEEELREFKKENATPAE
jgi:hypothetical protein